MAAVRVDGSSMEGGGQVLRCSIALAGITGTPVCVHDIRGKRPKPGLREQHLTGLRLVAKMCGAEVSGDAVHSREVHFHAPRRTSGAGGSYGAKISTAGAVSLVSQVSLPCALFAREPVALQLEGGTDVPFSPPLDFLVHVVQPTLARHCGASVEHVVQRRGLMPAGGGRVLLRVAPCASLRPVMLERRGEVVAVDVHVCGGGGRQWDARSVQQVGVEVRKALPRVVGGGVGVRVAVGGEETAGGEGASVVLVAHTSEGCLLAGSALSRQGRGGKPAAVARAACGALSAELAHGGCVCEHLQDQLVVFMALAQGTSRVLAGPLSLHTRTAITVCARLTGARFRVRRVAPDGTAVEGAPVLGAEDMAEHACDTGNHVIECDGVGWRGVGKEVGSAAGAGAGEGAGEGEAAEEAKR